MLDHSAEYLRRLLEDSRIVEVRHSYAGRWESGTFDDPVRLECAIRDRGDAGNLYTSLNRPTGIRAINAFGARALHDADIAVITRIVFDLDPKRPTGSPSTDHELQAAILARALVARTLAAHGWPLPALGISGNGAHLIFRTCLEATAVWRQQGATLYAGLRSRLQPQLAELNVEFDVTVRNPARIWRLYGTINRKGDATNDRPHRRASITLPAGPWKPVPAATIERTVRLLTPVVEQHHRAIERARGRVSGSGDYRTLDIVAWFTAHGAYRRPLVGDKHSTLCPWTGEHSTTSPASGSDTVIWEAADGWPRFHCSHAHCADRTLRDVIALWGDADAFCSRTWSRNNG